MSDGAGRKSHRGPAVLDLIETKRDGGRHSAKDLDGLVKGFVAGRVPDYQMAAWLMAAYLKGLDEDETAWLTEAMVRSGEVLDLSTIPGTTVDKHSTGGVGDTVTLVLAPVLAACGVKVAKMSGRGLGHTGGTLDKLGSIPGFRIELTPEEFVGQVRDIGIAVTAQSPRVDPADKLMYALRDATGTVPSIPLIVASIVSKKIAGGADVILVDVKVGSGAFMRTESDALALAAALRETAARLGKRLTCVMTDMSEPLGMSVGNALEVREAIETLLGHGPEELTEVCLALGGKMLHLAGAAPSEEEGRRMCAHSVASEAAIDVFRAWVDAQGGDARIVDDPDLLPSAREARLVTAARSGYLTTLDAEAVGRAAAVLGAGRRTKDDVIDPGAGVVLHVRRGVLMSEGQALATLYAASEEALDDGERRFLEGVTFAETASEPVCLLREL